MYIVYCARNLAKLNFLAIKALKPVVMQRLGSSPQKRFASEVGNVKIYDYCFKITNN